MSKKVEKFFNNEKKVSKLIFSVMIFGLAVAVSGSGVFAYFVRDDAGDSFDYGYGYGSDGVTYGYGYGYGSDMTADYTDYGYSENDGQATAVSVAQSGSGGLVVSYTTGYYAKNKVYYGTASTTCASLGTASNLSAFQTGANTITLSGLNCGTTYYYCVASQDAGDNVWYTDLASASTGTCGGGGGTGGTTVTTPTVATQTTVANVTTAAGGTVTLTTSEGSVATVVIPAAASTANLAVSVQSKSAATVEAAGTVGAPSTGLYRVGNLVFEVSATNASTSAAVSQFNKDITLTFTYTDAQIAGMTEDSLKVYTWDGAKWVALTSTVDKTNNKITTTVSHFSYFSIMGQKTATTTTSVTTTTVSTMTITQLKAKIAEVITALIQLINELITNLQAQLQAALTGGSQTAALSGVLNVNLKYGDSGDDVKLLQTWLAKDATIYPEAIISGNFGTATRAAVIRFQEKYTSEILTPAGLTKGNGLVGSLTRAKLNALYGSQ